MRHRLGPLEPAATAAFRRMFFDVDAFATLVGQAHPTASTVLEVGCGEGAVITALAERLPRARLTGIDPTSTVGRGFRGDRTRVAFVRTTLDEYVVTGPALVDLVVVCDVLHHMPRDDRVALVRQTRRLLRPGGVLVIKEWERRPNLANVLSGVIERLVSGARIVDYLTLGELNDLVRNCGDAPDELSVARLPPRINNVAVVMRTSLH